MKAIARLVLTNFAPTPLLRGFSVVALGTFTIALYLLRTVPHSSPLLWLAGIADILLVAGTSLMPLMFGRIARSRLIGALPHGRLKLLLSAFITLFIVSLPAPLCLSFGFPSVALGRAPTPQFVAMVYAAARWQFWFGLVSQMIAIGWLYLAMYFVSSQRSMAGYLKGLLVILAAIASPVHDSMTLNVTLSGKWLQLAVIWGVFAAGFLLWPRWKAHVARVRALTNAVTRIMLKSRVAGREVDLMLGTAHPWVLAAAQVIPVAFAATIGFYSASVWLYYLTIFCTVAGAIACQAAERSRALWLRGHWSREELFAQVERSFWTHNSVVVGVLIVLMLGIGVYTALPVAWMIAGLLLLVIATLLSTYLGLMITRGLHWLEAVLAISVMLALMAIAISAARSTENLPQVLLAEAALGVAAIVFRSVARRRWAQIDWTLCRADRALHARAAA